MNDFIHREELLGLNHIDPKAYSTRCSDGLAIGLAPVCSCRDSKYWLNEDAAGFAQTSELRILTVADAHRGRIASEYAVQRFPEAIVENQPNRHSRQSFEEHLFHTVFDFSATLAKAVKTCNVVYQLGEDYGNALQPDRSGGMFYSVIHFENKYYFIGFGDVELYHFRAADKTFRRVVSKNRNVTFFGGLSVHRWMHEELEDPIPKTSVRFDNPVARKALDVQVLDVEPRDILFLFSDGYKFDGHFVAETLFGYNFAQVLDILLADALKSLRHRSDNIAFGAMLVQ